MRRSVDGSFSVVVEASRIDVMDSLLEVNLRFWFLRQDVNRLPAAYNGDLSTRMPF
jgi:hypothetical protein